MIHAVYELAAEWPEFPMFIREAGRLGPNAFDRFGSSLEPLRVRAVGFLRGGDGERARSASRTRGCCCSRSTRR